MKSRINRLEEQFFRLLMILSTLTVFSCLVAIIGTVAIKGAGSMSLDMITKTPEAGFYLGKQGGVLNAIAGSSILAVSAVMIAFLISMPVALYVNLYRTRKSKLAGIVRLSLDFLWGVPSIVYGAFGFIVMIYLGLAASLLGGIVTVTLFILPIMARAMDEVIALVPNELIEASYGLGATRFETAFGVVMRQAAPGIVGASLLAFGRGIGDAASVLFTAGFSDLVPTSLLEPAATLPLAIFFQMSTPIPEVRERAYASAFILTALMLAISIAVRLLTSRFKRHIIR